MVSLYDASSAGGFKVPTSCSVLSSVIPEGLGYAQLC